MKLGVFWLLIFSFPIFAHCQNERPLTKMGGYLYLYRFSKYSGYSLNFERENVFRQNSAFTHGPRLDYSNAKPSPQTFFPGSENLILGYEVKVYPFYSRNKRSYKGLFLGINPCYFVNVKRRFKYGPGLGSLIGYQFWIKNKFSLSGEGMLIYMQNTNPRTTRQNPQDRYFYIFANVKLGLRL